jgi:3-hydroxyisobutyrate dehydrogenase-like beta-hydroxyacid dehydrogenase
MKVGFIGVGQMGRHMARHIAQGGHQVSIYDVRREAADAVVAAAGKNARAVDTIAEAVADAEVVCSSLPGPVEVEAIVTGPGGLLESMKPGTNYIDLSTNAPSMVRKLEKLLAAKNIGMLDAPVSGGIQGAEAGTLSVMVGGNISLFDKMQPVLQCVGTKLFHCGDIGNGCVTKLCNNLAGQAHAVIMAEVLTLGMKGGVELKTLASVIAASTGWNPRLVGSFTRRLFRRAFENPGFSALLSAKDTHLAIELAHELGVPMAMGEAVEADMQEVMRRGWGPMDFDIVGRIQEDRTGVVLELSEADAAEVASQRKIG